MSSPLFFAIGTALLMAGLLVEAGLFRALHDDLPSTYKLYALRDRLIRLVIDGEIAQDEPHFNALYRNINLLLRGCRALSSLEGWKVAGVHGRRLARSPGHHVRGLAEFPPTPIPQTLEPVIEELRLALQHVGRNHYGLFVMMNERRREQRRMQKEHARRWLSMMPSG